MVARAGAAVAISFTTAHACNGRILRSLGAQVGQAILFIHFLVPALLRAGTTL